MDALLARLGVQAVNYAIRSGLALTSTFAISQCSRLLKTVDDKRLRAELKALQKELDSKIQIVSPAVDLIEFKSGRGNVFLEKAVPLAKALRHDIVALGKRLENIACAEENMQANGIEGGSKDAREQALKAIICELKALLTRIDGDIPLLGFAITASGERLGSSVPPGVSPSRLLQASTLLSVGDLQYAGAARPVQIGPAFTLSIYMLFVGHASLPEPGILGRETHASGHDGPRMPLPGPEGNNGQVEEPYGLGDGERKPLWQEVMHKARVRLCRVPIDYEFDPVDGYKPQDGRQAALPAQSFRPDEYAYHLEIIEDLDDGRLHDDVQSRPYDTVPLAGKRESIPIHQLSKIFYTNTGRILNVGDGADGDNNPVLLLKRDVAARPPTRMAERLAMYGVFAYPEEGECDPDTDTESVDTQDEIDRQLQVECSMSPSSEPTSSPDAGNPWELPSHLDPEWIALEVFDEDGESESSGPDDDDDDSDEEQPTQPRYTRARRSLDPSLVDQIRHLSMTSSPAGHSPHPSRPPSQDFCAPDPHHRASEEALVARSPFGAITTSLSLLEMLVRLTGLQEFQQESHLSIPDHILTFFLEETSTTGLMGAEKWNVRNEARRRVGFDPYTDTPTRKPQSS